MIWLVVSLGKAQESVPDRYNPGLYLLYFLTLLLPFFIAIATFVVGMAFILRKHNLPAIAEHVAKLQAVNQRVLPVDKDLDIVDDEMTVVETDKTDR